jgi:indolepyruvate ferredoxin oxidoreductase alpha subunit
MERSFAEEVKQLQLGQGQVLRGEGILAITKGLLQSAGKGYARARAIGSETRQKLLADEKGIESALLEAAGP